LTFVWVQLSTALGAGQHIFGQFGFHCPGL
jgi:hypothetical protein